MSVAIELPRAVELLTSGRRIVVACHVNPDGDALGSALALGLGLQSIGVAAPVVFGTSESGTTVPRSLTFLPGQGLIADPDQVTELDVLVTSDTGSVDRLGPAARLVELADEVIVMDHHVSNTHFGSCELLDVTAASTSAIVGTLLDTLGVQWTADIATCLYAGLVTDTGSFRFQGATADVYRLAARMLDLGVDHVAAGRSLFDTLPFSAVQLLGRAMVAATLEPGLVWTVVTCEERVSAGLSLAEIESAVDLVRMTQEADVAAVFKGVKSGLWHVSLRSRGATDVSAIAVSLGGGGHRYAAGYTAQGSVAELHAGLRAALSLT